MHLNKLLDFLSDSFSFSQDFKLIDIDVNAIVAHNFKGGGTVRLCNTCQAAL